MGKVSGGGGSANLALLQRLRDYENKNNKIYEKYLTVSDLLEYGESIGPNSRIVRNGKIVILTLDGLITKENFTNQWNGVLNLPYGYKPEGRIYGLGYGLYGDLRATIYVSGGVLQFVKNLMHSEPGALTIYSTLTWITADDFPE